MPFQDRTMNSVRTALTQSVEQLFKGTGSVTGLYIRSSCLLGVAICVEIFFVMSLVQRRSAPRSYECFRGGPDRGCHNGPPPAPEAVVSPHFDPLLFSGKVKDVGTILEATHVNHDDAWLVALPGRWQQSAVGSVQQSGAASALRHSHNPDVIPL